MFGAKLDFLIMWEYFKRLNINPTYDKYTNIHTIK